MKSINGKIYLYLFLIITLIALLIGFVYFDYSKNDDNKVQTATELNGIEKYINTSSFDRIKKKTLDQLEYLEKTGKFGDWPLSIILSKNRGNPFNRKNK